MYLMTDLLCFDLHKLFSQTPSSLAHQAILPSIMSLPPSSSGYQQPQGSDTQTSQDFIYAECPGYCAYEDENHVAQPESTDNAMVDVGLGSAAINEAPPQADDDSALRTKQLVERPSSRQLWMLSRIYNTASLT